MDTFSIHNSPRILPEALAGVDDKLLKHAATIAPSISPHIVWSFVDFPFRMCPSQQSPAGSNQLRKEPYLSAFQASWSA
uniref:Uncharacterized protein n=1 Tax=Lepeophtheirus salmonis TaxID=72036 RepID=A0A0K2V305_LEPSM